MSESPAEALPPPIPEADPAPPPRADTEPQPTFSPPGAAQEPEEENPAAVPPPPPPATEVAGPSQEVQSPAEADAPDKSPSGRLDANDIPQAIETPAEVGATPGGPPAPGASPVFKAETSVAGAGHSSTSRRRHSHGAARGPPVEGEKPPGDESEQAPVKKSKKFVPLQVTYKFDEETMNEMIERRNMDTLRDSFGDVEGMARTFDSNVVKGIANSTLELRNMQFGPNELAARDPVTFLEFLIDAFKDKIIILLCITAVISTVFGLTLPNPHTGHVDRKTGWIEGVAILASVAIVTLTGAINNYRKAKKFEEMEHEQSVKDVSVVRDGEVLTIKSNTITVGDLLTIETGMQMVCDGLAVTCNGLKMNESTITGEPDLIEKDRETDVFIISGTTADEGTGTMLVIAIGMSTFQGQLKETLDIEAGETPLQEHLSSLADDIGKIGMAAALILVVGLSIKEIILITTGSHPASAVRFLNFIIIAVTLIAVAIPEGLPLAVTISLAFSMRAMMTDMCMVRVLASCETMGAATAIASDKTGTLTTNQMTVVQGCIAQKEFMFSGYGLHPRTADVAEVVRSSPLFEVPPAIMEKMCFALSINSTAKEASVDGEVLWTGNKTEIGLLGFAAVAGHSYVKARESVAAADMVQFPFSSLKKRMTTVVRGGSETLAYVKGASETILEQCEKAVDCRGVEINLDDVTRAQYNEIITDMANQGNRTIGVAVARVAGGNLPREEPELERLVFLGVLGIQDPIREAVPHAVVLSNAAGLVVRMVTGDNINTAIAIAKKCNIFRENGYDHAMTGIEFRQMYRENKTELIALLPRLRVLARSSPNDKHILVGLLQEELHDVVGVTGDGTNDAPALKLADVGFAMNSGTDIAKGAADMVLLDDNFATVVTAIKWGRAVNDNVKKFLQYQLTINLAGVLLTLIGSLASAESKEPIAPVQLLWLNLIMDTLAALALATEKPEDACLFRNPVFKQAPLITMRMKSFIGVHALFQVIVVTLLLFFGHKWFNLVEKSGDVDCDAVFPDVLDAAGNATAHPQRVTCDKVCTDYGGTLAERQCQQGATHSTIIFNTFIWFQVFNVLNARKLYGEFNIFDGLVTRSVLLLQVFLVIVVLQVLSVQFFGVFMKTIGLTGIHWGLCLGIAAVEIPLGIVVRLLPIKEYVPPEVENKTARDQEMILDLRNTHGASAKPTSLVAQSDPALKKANISKRRSSASNSFRN